MISDQNMIFLLYLGVFLPRVGESQEDVKKQFRVEKHIINHFEILLRTSHQTD